MTSSRHFLAPYIWLNAENSGAWAHNVLLKVGMSGCWQAIDTRPSAAAMQPATLLPGTVLPSIVNAHSHAFQRAFAGMSETRVNDSDHFWSWRDRMYGVANRITPEQMQTIAAQLYCFTALLLYYLCRLCSGASVHCAALVSSRACRRRSGSRLQLRRLLLKACMSCGRCKPCAVKITTLCFLTQNLSHAPRNQQHTP